MVSRALLVGALVALLAGPVAVSTPVAAFHICHEGGCDDHPGESILCRYALTLKIVDALYDCSRR